MDFTYYSHSTFLVAIKGKKVLFDPYFTDNPKASEFDVNEIEADYIFISHGHVDHVMDAVHIAKLTHAKVVSNPEVIAYVQDKGVENVHELNHGAPVLFEFGHVRAVPAMHSSSMPDGRYGGNPMGFVFTTDEGNFYYSGDTCLITDMQLIALFAKLDFAVLPIGGNYTMDYKDAFLAAEFIKCDKVIGVHYNTFPLIEIDPHAAVNEFQSKGKFLLLPKCGERFVAVKEQTGLNL
ncbi:metal-dependent hydrolase [Haoranjiania flava]|uniref:Metal-dependent hydrolase n=1 Tax=Haoranjiania flava TaxID=1856322 RepID=A0AAE3IMN1_9BACT|nr:metal-dependent hydrolase [Haoranjiania flava]MCU7694870.1 metal-dependent hydrolase [Haoranjiania flava]